MIVVIALLFAATGSFAQKPEQPTAGARSNHSSLASEVRHQLALLPWISPFDNLQYWVDGKNVTLSGQVTEPIIRDEAVEAVQGIEGVGQRVPGAAAREAFCCVPVKIPGPGNI